MSTSFHTPSIDFDEHSEASASDNTQASSSNVECNGDIDYDIHNDIDNNDAKQQPQSIDRYQSVPQLRERMTSLRPEQPIDEHLPSTAMDLSATIHSDNRPKDSSRNDGISGIKREAARTERKTLAKQETRVILILRCLVGLIVVILAIATAASVYFYVRDAQHDKFRTEFRFHAAKVMESFNQVIEQKLSAVDSLSISITSYALGANATFPNVTLPDFEVKGSSSRIIGDMILLFYLPLVTEENRVGWEQYSRDNNEHIIDAKRDERLFKAEQDSKYGYANSDEPNITIDSAQQDEVGAIDGNSTIPGEIWSPDTDKLEAPYMPIWQVTPVLPKETQLLNQDMRGSFYAKGSLDEMLKTGQASLDEFTNLADRDSEHKRDDATEIFDLLLQFGQFRHNDLVYEGDPLSALSYPVFDSFGKDKVVTGALFTLIYWRHFFANILPENIEGIVCVLSNSNGEQATYQIDGGAVSFLGNDDHHDPDYGEYGRADNKRTVIDEAEGPDTRSFTTVDLNLEYISYELRIYPSDTFRDLYVDSRAVVEAIVAVAIFIVAALIFAIYDFCVERRQRIVLDRAVKSTAVVSSLFPPTVRDRVLEYDSNVPRSRQQRQQQQHQNQQTKHRLLNKKKRRSERSEVSSKNSDMSAGGSTVDEQSLDKGHSPPIAEKFASCTVLFADIAGFTRWSSDREPEEVFELLESIFKSFDAAAMRRNVFKVETIGDCYMAVTGVPQSQPDHAIRMAKFSYDCIHGLDEIVHKLSNKLGAGTESLALRIGMHSGCVTAGVLRGEKSRFQLFGDTVNTASRMESTGIPGRIQVSQSTADSIATRGKGNWLVPRQEKVFAKGKGEMQTYWINAESPRRSSITMQTDGGDTPTQVEASA